MSSDQGELMSMLLDKDTVDPDKTGVVDIPNYGLEQGQQEMPNLMGAQVPHYLSNVAAMHAAKLGRDKSIRTPSNSGKKGKANFTEIMNSNLSEGAL